MMQARIAALQVAGSQVGTHEVGFNNRGPMVDEYQKADDLPGEGYAWCAAFVQWCFKQVNKPLPNRTASVGYLLHDAVTRGWVVSKPAPGDLVAYQFTSDNWPDHVGIVERVVKFGPILTIQTVEGNTSPGDGGSQSDGGGVYRRTRVVSASRVSFIRVPGVVGGKLSPALLRTLTGYWSWLQWTLGEDKWEGYRPFDLTLRPNVPARIPALWWARRKLFLAARKAKSVVPVKSK